MPRTARELRLSVLGAALGLAACPYSNSPFEGVWTVTDGGVTVICDGGTTSEAAAGSIVVIDAHASLYVSIEGHSETFEISGSSANSGAQSILLTDDAGFENGWTLSLENDALSLSGDTLSESTSGTEETADAGQVCSFVRQLTAVRGPL